jgi:DNA-binding NarL/FixJ family response regulator
MQIRLAIVENQTLVRYALRELTVRQPDIEIVAECRTAAEAPQVLSLARPDVVTVSASLPDGDGLRLARELRDRHAGLGIVILTSRGEDDILFRAMETGVSAFVAESAPVEEVLCAIRHSAVAASSFTAAGLATALMRRRDVRERLALSPREIEVLRLLRDGLSVPAIAQQMFISYSTTKTYVARLYKKLGAVNRTQALMAAVQYGLISSGPQAPGVPRAPEVPQSPWVPQAPETPQAPRTMPGIAAYLPPTPARPASATRG